MRCLILLKGTGSAEPSAMSKDPHIRRQLVGGCTCGECLEGFLTPRMQARLSSNASRLHREKESINLETGPDWVDSFRRLYPGCLPSTMLNHFRASKASRLGFLKLCEHIYNCLRLRRYLASVMYWTSRLLMESCHLQFDLSCEEGALSNRYFWAYAKT